MSKVTFDYSKACSFVQEHEMEYMSGLVAQAKDNKHEENRRRCKESFS